MTSDREIAHVYHVYYHVLNCEHDGKRYADGEVIKDSQNPCLLCYCQRGSIACTFLDCLFRPNCAPEYVPGECCPQYNHCSSVDSNNSTEAGLVSSTETAFNFEKTTISTQASETMPSEAPEITSTPETKAEEDADPSDLIKPENLDPLALFSLNERQDSDSSTETKTDNVPQSGSNISLDEDISSDMEPASIEESSSEKQEDEKKQEETEFLKTGFEIINDEEKPEASESSEEDQNPTELSSDASTSAATSVNAELFPNTESAVKDEIKTEAEENVQTSVATELPTTTEEANDKANELIKKFRSLENLTTEEGQKAENEGQIEIGGSKDDKIDDIPDPIKPSDVDVPEDAEKSTPNPEKNADEELKIKENTESSKSDLSTAEAVEKPENLYYDEGKKQAVPESVETVTTVIHVKEEATSDKEEPTEEDISSTISKEAEQLFKSISEALETIEKQETTKTSDETVSIQSMFETPDSPSTEVVENTSTSSSSKSDEPEDKIKLNVDESKVPLSTEAVKVPETENSTTEEVPASSSEKVELIKE
ncbi:uncharacterized protein CDAR_310371 [Caerostris darwini]|uniref:VWFC domain-containing protein n=1 Tax=Caerostris darwini TaxID=1538125 RepID=A0AAV4TF17_9ARAC|nr:uncharacterized protein CDAR_310371 [Caerostris darwini]